jgi:hypothetical protein
MCNYADQVRLGSQADITTAEFYVRFAPESGPKAGLCVPVIAAIASPANNPPSRSVGAFQFGLAAAGPPLNLGDNG